MQFEDYNIYSAFSLFRYFILLYPLQARDAITKIASQFKEDIPDMDNTYFLNN